MKLGYLTPALIFLLSGALLSANSQARTAESGGESTSAKVKKSKTNKVIRDDPDPYLHGSRETVKQRDRRLTRECKGGVNAGACAGYTR